MTNYCSIGVDVDYHDKTSVWFVFDGNSKVTVGNGTFDNPSPNAFSLVQVDDCPEATPICKSVCYVHKLEKKERLLHDCYRHNSKWIRWALEEESRMKITEDAFAEWISKNASKGFRWHISGDIFSMRYARFIRNVCLKAPNVPFWIYTRSFSFLSPLVEAPNLEVNLSADKDNWLKALRASRWYNLRLCYLTVDGSVPELPEDSVIFPDYSLRGRDLTKPTEAEWWKTLTRRQKRQVCPADFFGQSEVMRCGPCDKCLLQPAVIGDKK